MDEDKAQEQETTTETAVEQETEQKTTESTEASGGKDTAQETESAEEGAEDDKKTKSVPKWFQERINEVTAKTRAEERKRIMVEDQNKQLLAELAKRPKAEGASDGKLTAEDVDRLASEKAQDIARANAFNAKCDAVFDKGVEVYPDFKETLGTFNMLGGVNQPMLEAIIELEEPHKVIHYLGTNPDDASRVLRMAPTKMAIELAKLEASLNREVKKPVSKAPAPTRQVDSRAGSERDLDDPKVSMSEYIKRREKQLADRRR